MLSYVFYFFVIFILNFLLLCFLRETLKKNCDFFSLMILVINCIAFFIIFIVSFLVLFFNFLLEFLESVF